MKAFKQLNITFQSSPIKACAFTGHRELGADFSKSRMKKQIQLLIQRGVEVFYDGMAQGFDLLAAEALLALKKKYPQVKLIACIPFYGQEKNYSEKDKSRYAKVLKKADEQVLLSERYYNGCFLTRDRYMADRADVLLAYYTKNTGGTAYTVSYFARRKPDAEIINV